MPIDPSFRMTVEDVFNIRGRGTVVTGRIERGTLRAGDAVEVETRTGVKRTVATSIEMFRRQITRAGEGDMVGIFLHEVGKDEVQRGDVLAGTKASFNWQ
jgi:elongation factor Tu